MKHFLKTALFGILLVALLPRVGSAWPSDQPKAKARSCQDLCRKGDMACITHCRSMINDLLNGVEGQKEIIDSPFIQRKPSWLQRFKKSPQMPAVAAPMGILTPPSPPGPPPSPTGMIVAIPEPSAVADLLAQQKCVDDYLQCFRECTNGTEPKITADDSDLGAACQKIRDPNNAAVLCKAKNAGCVFLTCDFDHQNPLNQKAAGYLACSHQNDYYLQACPGLFSDSEQIRSYLREGNEALDFMSHNNLDDLFVKTAGVEMNAVSGGGCPFRVPPEATPLFNCVSACWIAPYGAARCNETTIRTPNLRGVQ